MATQMTEDQWRAFLSAGTRTGKLATVRKDGRPHIAPIWFLLDGPDLVITTGKESVKGRTLARSGQAALCVDDDRPPFAFVIVEGEATLHDDPAELKKWSTAIAARYIGTKDAAAFGERNSGPDEVLVRVRIDKVLAMQDMTS